LKTICHHQYSDVQQDYYQGIRKNIKKVFRALASTVAIDLRIDAFVQHKRPEYVLSTESLFVHHRETKHKMVGAETDGGPGSVSPVPLLGSFAGNPTMP
jgi:hypothetical protein